jgi:tRNA A-37 threonylcarbamoyl transferase component Bud32
MRPEWTTNSESLTDADRDVFGTMDTLLAEPMESITQDAASGVSRMSLRQTYYVKTFQGRGNRIQHLLGRSRFQRELRNLQYFSSLGLATPELVAHGLQHRLGLMHRAVMVTREVPGAVDLEQYLRAGKLYSRGSAGARHILEQLATATRTLHDQGFYHWDLKARNILVRTTPEGPQLLFFDCPRGYHPPKFMFRKCVVRELAHIERGLRGYVRPVDMLYAFKIYRGCTRLTEEDKSLARDALGYYQERRMTSARRRRAERRQANQAMT